MTTISRSSAPMCTDDPHARALEAEESAKQEASRKTAALDRPIEPDPYGNAIVEVVSGGLLSGLRIVTEKALTGAGEVALTMAKEVAKAAAKKVVKDEAWKTLTDTVDADPPAAVDRCTLPPYVICG